jgi:hypothetical protein
MHQEVKVVAHQAVVVVPDGEALAVALPQVQEVGPLLVVGEDGLAVMAALQDVLVSRRRGLLLTSRARQDGPRQMSSGSGCPLASGASSRPAEVAYP